MKPKYPCLEPIAVKCSCGCGQTTYRNKYTLKRFPKSYVSGHQFRGNLNTNWNDGKYTAKDGYSYIRKPDHPNADKRGYVRESVFVMASGLGRPIAQNEVVHHINGIKTDNRPENLIVITRQSHASVHHKGLIKPNSIKNLRTTTSDDMKKIWETSRAKDRRFLVCENCCIQFSGQRHKENRHIYCSRKCYFSSKLS